MHKSHFNHIAFTFVLVFTFQPKDYILCLGDKTKGGICLKESKLWSKYVEILSLFHCGSKAED